MIEGKKGFYKVLNNIPKINDKLNYNQSVDLVREKLFNSIKLRLRTDKNIGCMLSAGIDSSSIAATVKKNLIKISNIFLINQTTKIMMRVN